MPYVTSVERIGIRKGIQQGLQQCLQQRLATERQLLLRMVLRRFGAKVSEQSKPLLDQIDNAQSLESLGEALIDSADSGAWLEALESTLKFNP